MKQRLLLEGNDIHVIVHFCLKRGITGILGFKNEEDFKQNFVLSGDADKGKKGRLRLLKASIVQANFDRLGIILDADESAQGTWQAVKSILEKRGYQNLPAKMGANGLLADHPELPKIGLWIMPDNEKPGDIEHFFKTLVPPDDPFFQKAEATTAEILVSGKSRFSEKKKVKAEVHSWLAWQEEPGISMGIALKTGLAATKNDLADRFLNWFEQIFDLEKPAQSPIQK